MTDTKNAGVNHATEFRGRAIPLHPSAELPDRVGRGANQGVASVTVFAGSAAAVNTPAATRRAVKGTVIASPGAGKTASLLSAIGEPTRWLIVRQLAADGPRHLGELADVLGLQIGNVSRHVGVMKAAGILSGEKQGRRVVYGFRPEVFTPPDENATDLGTLNLGECVLVMAKTGESTPRPLPTSSAARGK